MRLVDPETSEEWILGRAILRALIQELREDQVRPVLLIMPSEAWVLRRKPDSLHRSIMRFSKREGVDVIDLLPAFTAKVAESKIDDYFIPMDRHWTDKGHELASQEIHKFLTAKHYVR